MRRGPVLAGLAVALVIALAGAGSLGCAHRCPEQAAVWLAYGLSMLALAVGLAPLVVPRLRRAQVRRVTTPPRVLGLLPMCFVALVVGTTAFDLASVPYFTVVDPRSVRDVLPELAAEAVELVVASLLLRRLVRRWVVRQPPDPPRALSRATSGTDP